MEQIEGVGSRAGEGVLVEDLFCQGADQGLAAELAPVVFFGALDDVVDVKGTFGGDEYVVYNIHIRLTFGCGWGGLALFSAAKGAQGAELCESRVFKDLNEVVFIDGVHGERKMLATGHNIWYEYVYVNTIIYLFAKTGIAPASVVNWKSAPDQIQTGWTGELKPWMLVNYLHV
jgi:hypothetical protein